MRRRKMKNFHDIITESLKPNNKKTLKPNDQNSMEAWEDIRHYLDMCINTQPIRIHDSEKKGVFHHDEKRLNQKKLSEEEGLTYALFNSREYLKLPEEKKLIAFEAYLLRKPESFPKAATVKCDLIAYNPDKRGPKKHELELTAVEVKKDPSKSQTNLKFGMLQAKAYGYLLTRLHAQEINLLKEHITHCLGSYYENNKNDEYDGRIKYISFALAAPESYFLESLKIYPNIGDFLAPLEEPYFSLVFDGYWVIEEPCGPKATDGKGDLCKPMFDRSKIPNIKLCKNFSELKTEVL
jgi:hypothetical protein